MEFKNFKKEMQANFKEMIKGATHLFEVSVDNEEMWNLYLDSFPEGTNEIYRERKQYDCNCCNHFIKEMGKVVSIKDNQIHTVWDIPTTCTTFSPVTKAMADYIRSKVIVGVYVSKLKKIGTDKNHGMKDGKVVEYNHFYFELPNNLVDKSSDTIGTLKGNYRATRDVFKRSLDELTEDSVMTVLELIAQNSLYRGEEWKDVLNKFLKLQKEYNKLSDSEKEIYAWEQSVKVGGAISRIRNHSMGTLLVDISEGIELDIAVRKYEKIIAPSNYKRPKAIYTKKMLEDAKAKIQELGYMGSLRRRYANLDDISINDVLFSNRDSANRMQGLDVFEEMSQEIAINPKKFTRVEEVSIQDFVTNMLPMAREIEILLENKHASNMASLIAPQDKSSKTMFKWGNNFSWSYSGNIADSSMRDRVKSAGGKVDGVLRFSIQWNDEKQDKDDLDAHCYEPNGNLIYFSKKRNPQTTGQLDIDIQRPVKGEPAVENITWTDRRKMLEGRYQFLVYNYLNRGESGGFRAEIEFDGEVHSFNYSKPLRDGEKVIVAEVVFSKDKGFTIEEKLPSATSTREVWGLSTNQFVPVGVICYSPNYWGDNKVGNKHYMFMLKDCTNPEMASPFYNEFLNPELTKHRKVMEALGTKMRVEDCEDQLSGLGFSSTRRNEIIVKVKGASEKIVKVKF